MWINDIDWLDEEKNENHDNIDISNEANLWVIDVLENPDNRKLSIIKELSKSLWLTETQEMLDLRNEMLSLISKRESIKFINLQYEEEAKIIINDYFGEDFNKAQIALNLLKASIYLEWWNKEYYDEDLEDVLMYARWMCYDDIVEKIESL